MIVLIWQKQGKIEIPKSLFRVALPFEISHNAGKVRNEVLFKKKNEFSLR